MLQAEFFIAVFNLISEHKFHIFQFIELNLLNAVYVGYLKSPTDLDQAVFNIGYKNHS